MSDTTPMRLIRMREVVQRTGLSRTTIYRMKEAGTFPQSVALGENSIAWRSNEIDAWFESLQPSQTTSPLTV